MNLGICENPHFGSVEVEEGELSMSENDTGSDNVPTSEEEVALLEELPLEPDVLPPITF